MAAKVEITVLYALIFLVRAYTRVSVHVHIYPVYIIIKFGGHPLIIYKGLLPKLRM